MTRHRGASVVALLVVMALGLSACAQRDDEGGSDPAQVTPTDEPTESPDAPASGEDVRPELSPVPAIEDPLSVPVLFSSDRSGTFHLYRVLDGEVSQLTFDDSYDDWWPRRSPDGTLIAFYRTPIEARPDTGGGITTNYAAAALWTMNADGTELTERISGDRFPAQATVNWAPDSNTLVMAAIDPDESRWHLFLMSRDDFEPQRLTARKGLFVDPSFSPDGSRIVYTAYPDGADGTDLALLEIHTMAVDGTDERRLTNDEFRDQDPYWAPDGTEIAYTRTVDPAYLGVGQWALRAVTPGPDPVSRDIINDGNINTAARWSPDSSGVYFHRLEFGNGIFHVAYVDRDGNNLISLTPPSDVEDTDVDVPSFPAP